MKRNEQSRIFEVSWRAAMARYNRRNPKNSVRKLYRRGGEKTHFVIGHWQDHRWRGTTLLNLKAFEQKMREAGVLKPFEQLSRTGPAGNL